MAPRVLVVACHACQHLAEEVLDIAARFGAHVCVMPPGAAFGAPLGRECLDVLWH